MLSRKLGTPLLSPALAALTEGRASQPVVPSTSDLKHGTPSDHSAQGAPANDQGLPERIAPWEMESLLSAGAAGFTTLSLDCFDTLLWRQTYTPIDVFYDLQNHPAYQKHHLTAKLRAWGEGRARTIKTVEKQKSEVTLRQIYQTAAPGLSDHEYEELEDAELAAEMTACYPFPATAQLILRAKELGLRVIIVSDTYFSEGQLRQLLAKHLPDEVYSSIDRVFCSSQTGRSKANGLFADVLEELREKPHRILHLGDNAIADFSAARNKGVFGVHMQQFEESVAEFLRLAAVGCALVNDQTRRGHSLASVYHGLFASQSQEKGSAHQLGYLGCGPILYAFGHFVRAELERLRREGRRVHPFFLMRDAYLPQLVFEELFPGEDTSAVSISRFAAYASSFDNRAAVVDYLSRSAGSGRIDAMANQLLLPSKLRESIVRQVKKSNRPNHEFVRQILKPQVLNTIYQESKKYRQRLYRYVETKVDLEPGDTLLFIDLGYEGTAQRCLAPLLDKEQNWTVRGCYLMAASVPGWQQDRVGLLDSSWCDDRSLATLIPYVAVLEDLCTVELGSVIDYGEDGTPIFADHLTEEEQSRRVEPVQEACVQFAKDADDFFSRAGGRPSMDKLRLSAAGFITRLLFFPSRSEVDYLSGFHLDMGLGTSDKLALFDVEQGLEALRQRGLFFTKEIQGAVRTNYPIELRAAALELSLATFAQKRFGLDFAPHDMSFRSLVVSVLAVSGEGSTTAELTAQSTHDGCFCLHVPVGACAFDVGILLGKELTSAQLLSCKLIATEELLGSSEARHSQDVLADLRLEGARASQDGIVLFESDAAFLFFSPGGYGKPDTNFVLRLVFRPLGSRNGPPTDTGYAKK